MSHYTADSPILGNPPADVRAHCIRYMLTRAHGAYTAHDIQNVIVPAYFTVCSSVGMDPVMLLAQMIHETGNLTSWWAQRPRRNPAGIGVTGNVSRTRPAAGAWAARDGMWVEGVSFASWATDAIPAHVGRLLAYALHDDRATRGQQALIGGALAVRPLPASLRGAAPTWRGLNGRWAEPGTTYAARIAEIANAIMCA